MDTSNNTNKHFVVNFSELEGRLDPNFYKKTSYFNSRTYPSFKLSEIAFINPSTSFEKLNKEESITFVPMVAIDESDGIITKTFSKKIKDTQGFTRFLEGDLIWAKITPCMQNGKSAIVTKTLNGYACGSTEFFIIRPKKGNLLIGYIHFLLRHERVLEGAQNHFGGSAGQQRVSKDFLLNFNVPMPPMDVQKNIVALHNNAYTQKQQKEAEAEQLLQSIDTYILDKLGIIIPEKDNSLANRVFVTRFSEVTGGRLDPYFYTNNFKRFFENIHEQKKYPVLSLKKLSDTITSGITPLSGGDAYTTESGGIPFIRSGNINIDGDLDFNNLLYLKPEIHNTIMKSSKLQYNDLMVAIVGATIGQIGIYLFKREANINQAIALIRLKKGYNPNFIKEIMKSSIGQNNLDRLKRPVARANINLEEIATMQLIIPPLAIQEEIANHITTIRNKAKQLKADAITVLNNAKAEIEEMIIG